MIRKAISLGALLLCSLMVLPASSAVDELHMLFVESLEEGDLDSAVESYEELQKEVAKDARDASRLADEARKRGNKEVVEEQEAYLKYLIGLKMDAEETDMLLDLILESGESHYSVWLYLNSEYYKPTLTVDWSTSGESLSSDSVRTLTVQPGTWVHLPSAIELKLPLSRTGMLEGWGTAEGELLYEPGEAIEMPLEDTTLYAVWKTAVSFFDPFSGLDMTVEGVKQGDLVGVPVLPERDGYLFAGWWDRTSGAYIAPEDTEFAVEGNGAFFEALWVKLTVKNLMPRRYVGSIPPNKPAEFAFVLKNDGTERMTDVEVEFTSDELLLNRNVFNVKSISAGKEQYMTGLNIVADGEGSYPLTATVTDKYGHEWEYSFTVKAQ